MAQIIFNGGDPTNYEETAPLYNKWAVFFSIFDMCKHSRYGNYVHLPASGGILDQPAKTMSALEIMRDEWIKKISEEMRKK